VPYVDWRRSHPGSYLPGASGQLTADQFGRVRRVLLWVKFQDGLARPIGGSLEMDDVPASAPPTGDPTSTPSDTIAPASSASSSAPASTDQPTGH